MAAYAALVSLKHIIDNLRFHPRPPISLEKIGLPRINNKVIFMRKFLEGYNPNLGYSTEADPLESRIANAAYAAEDAIESHIVKQITSHGKKISSSGLCHALMMVIKDMELIEKEAMEIQKTMGVQHQLHTKSTPHDDDPLRSSSIEKKVNIMVGVDDFLLGMKDKLTSSCRDLQIIPIVGMGGTGKTTLALNIYHDRLIKEHFHICAWATISQEYSIQEILIEVLRQLNENVGQQSSEDTLGDRLYKHLYGRKYLIVLDDMWSIDAWDKVRSFFPNNGNGSRIVVTTRLSNLASKLDSSNSLEMELLDEANSWDLLSRTVFGKESCPLELEEIGKKIGKSCKGLPLSITVVGGVLAKSKHAREFWEYIEGNLNSIVNLEDDERCLKILHLSYKQLPVYLKPCFLYMGIFPEDKVIRIPSVVKLWVAEGFLKPVEGKSLEEVAREYLEDLISRNLILLHGLGSTGNMKYCKMHDLLRDLCMREAKKERFYTTVVTQEPTPQGTVVTGQRRIVMSGWATLTSTKEANDALTSMPLARSLMWNHDDRELPWLRLRLLRVLGSSLKTPRGLKDKIHQLVNLRFITIIMLCVGECKFPSSVYWNLQTLIVTGPYQVDAPPEIWYMPHMRHVMVNRLNLPDPPRIQDGVVLGKLQTLGKLKNFRCSKEVVRRIPNIKKLKTYYYETLVDSDCLSNLSCLDKLESFKCTFCPELNLREPSLLGLINFPHSLKKLSLRIKISHCWDDTLDAIGVLPHLEKLRLTCGIFKEGEWKTAEGQFRSLKFLSVRSCRDLRVWTSESSHFPCLEHLHLYQNSDLEEIPFDFAEISTLRVIDVDRCSISAAVSAKRILDEQEELYGDEAALRVQVRLWKKNEALEGSASHNFRVEC